MEEKETVVQDTAVTDEAEVIVDDTVTTKKSKKTMMIIIVIASAVLLLVLLIVGGMMFHAKHCEDQRLQTSWNISAKIESTLTPILGRYGLTNTDIEFVHSDDLDAVRQAFEHIDIRADGFGKLGPDEARELFHDLEEAANDLDFTDCDVTVEGDSHYTGTSIWVDSIRMYPNMTTDQYYVFVENEMTAVRYGLIESLDDTNYVCGIYFYDGSQLTCLAEYPYGWSGERRE